jgi:hypothetical protein
MVRVKPVVDFLLAHHGSICLLTSLTPAGDAWLDEHIPPDAPTWGQGFAIEPRYVEPIIDGLMADGLFVEEV